MVEIEADDDDDGRVVRARWFCWSELLSFGFSVRSTRSQESSGGF